MDITRPSFSEAEIESIRKTLDSGWVTQGPMTTHFEQKFGLRHKAPFSLATTSCTAALHLSTWALGLSPEDEMICPAFTWVTSAHSAEYVGAKAVFVDVNENTFNLDPHLLESAITPRTKAIMAVHLFGLSAQMDEIMAIAKRHNLFVIEDAACAVGTTYKSEPIGTIGDFGCFSFHPRKVITTGEGGMVTTRNSDMAEIVKSLRNHGSTGHPDGPKGIARPWTMGTFERLGMNLRLSDIQSAVGVAQLDKLDGLLEHRKNCAKSYFEMLDPNKEIALPYSNDERCGHTYQSFVIRILEGGLERRNRIMDHLFSKGIQTRPGTHAVHRLGYYRKKYSIAPEQFPIACLSQDTTITLPIFPGMTISDQSLVVETLQEGLKL